jgi:nitrate reductase gamma subunit
VSTFLWIIFPYLCLASFFIGLVWRYRFDQFGWTSRSSQMYEDRVLAVASPLFHFGILGVFAGHFLGLVIPESATVALGVPESTYHLIAEVGGVATGLMTVVGLLLLIARRGLTLSIFQQTTRMDVVMYLLLAGVIALGMYNTIGLNVLGPGYDYRLDVSVWFRGVFLLQPDARLMASADLSFQIHALLAFGLVAVMPYTRLVHLLSVPLGYLIRPYVVYRTRDKEPGARPERRGWGRLGF